MTEKKFLVTVKDCKSSENVEILQLADANVDVSSDRWLNILREGKRGSW